MYAPTVVYMTAAQLDAEGICTKNLHMCDATSSKWRRWRRITEVDWSTIDYIQWCLFVRWTRLRLRRRSAMLARHSMHSSRWEQGEIKLQTTIIKPQFFFSVRDHSARFHHWPRGCCQRTRLLQSKRLLCPRKRSKIKLQRSTSSFQCENFSTSYLPVFVKRVTRLLESGSVCTKVTIGTRV